MTFTAQQLKENGYNVLTYDDIMGKMSLIRSLLEDLGADLSRAEIDDDDYLTSTCMRKADHPSIASMHRKAAVIRDYMTEIYKSIN